MRKKLLWIVVCLLVSILGASCGPSQEELDTEATEIAANVYATQTAEAPTLTPTATPTSTPIPTTMPTSTPPPTSTPTPTPTSTPTETPTPEPLTAEEIVALVSPVLALIDTPKGMGSGLLIEGRYLVTAAHVVWPFEQVRVVFADGSEHADVPVHGWDLMTDLAVVGPIETDVDPAELGDGEQLAAGSDVFLIGFTGADQTDLSPGVAAGQLSRLREWKPAQLTYLQTSAKLADSQAGGVLVSDEGAVIGISGFNFIDQFNLVASAADVLTRVEALLAGEDVSGLGDRRLPDPGEQQEHDLTLHNFWEERVFVLYEPPGTRVELSVQCENNAYFDVLDVLGQSLYFADETFSGTEAGSVETALDAPHFLTLEQRDESEVEVQVSSSHGLALIDDPDDGRVLQAGDTVSACTDHPLDYDYYTIELEADQMVDIVVESISLDPVLVVNSTRVDGVMTADADSGRGLFGHNAKLTFRAPEAGSYAVWIAAFDEGGMGGYILSVTESPPDAEPARLLPRPTPPAPEPTPTPMPPAPTPSSSAGPPGKMALYKSAGYPFSIEYPGDWTAVPSQGWGAMYSDELGGSMLAVIEDNLAEYGMGGITLEQYADIHNAMLADGIVGYELVSRDMITTQQGRQAVVLTFTYNEGLSIGRRFLYLHEGTVGFVAHYTTLFRGSPYLEVKPLIEYSFTTFRVTDGQ